MDLSRLSNEDLIALRDGDLSRLSDEALLALKQSGGAHQEPAGFGTPRDYISGVNRTISGIGDALVAGYNLMLPKQHEVQPLSEGLRSVGVDLDRPRSFLGILGEYSMPGPGGAKTQAIQTGLAAAGGYLARQIAPDSALAEFAGSMAAPLSITGAQAATRAAFRGKDATKMAEAVARADALGAPITVGAASQNPGTMTLERLSGSVPGGVNRFRQAGMEAAEAIKRKLVSITGGESDDVVKSGRLIQRGLFDPDTGWTKRTMDVRNALYDKLDEKLSIKDWFAARGTPEGYPATVSGGPELQGAWPSARWADDTAPLMRAELGPSGQMLSAVNREGRIARRSGIQGALGIGGDVPPSAINAAGDIQLPSAPQPRAAGVAPGIPAVNARQYVISKGGMDSPLRSLFKDPETQKWFDGLLDELDYGSGRLSYKDLKQLRTQIGDMLGDPQLIGSTKRNTLDEFYKVLSKDMEAAADNAGALKEFNRANNYHKARIARIEDFYDTLYKKTTPEEVWNAVIGDSPKSASRISAIRKGLTPDEWRYLRKTVVTRMGKPVASAAKEGDIGFSAGTFLTNYERMKDKGALSAIFGTGQYRKDLDAVAQYASDLRRSAEVLSNPSGTAGLGLTASVYYGALGMLGMGLGGGPISGLGGIAFGLVANNTVARLMNNQRFVHWLARSTKLPEAAMANHLKRLPIILGNDPQALEDAQEFIDAVSGAAP